ncbi:MAG: ParB N-terminal domain-containing protein [Oscillospiraceae bacterium]|nr:ParB N-terminal domain-containing protein [Oscillospiraceae bacterium]
MPKRKLDAAIVSDLKAVTGDSFKDNLFMLPISSLSPSEDNFYSMSDIELLADDIERQGLKHNLVVNADAEKRAHYYIISGHRRFEAIRFLSENGRYPSQVIPCFVAGTKTRAESMLDLIMLNATSRKMTDAEYIQQYDKLEATLRELDAAGKSVPGRMRERIASVLKVSPAQIGKIENILHNGIEEVQQAVRSGEMSISTASAVSSLPAESQSELIGEKSASGIRNKDVQDYKEQHQPEPEYRIISWDGEIQKEAVMEALLRFATEYEKPHALNMNAMEYTDHFRRSHRSQYNSFSSFSVEGSFDKVTVKFENPAEHDNIKEIYMTWSVAAKQIQKYFTEPKPEKKPETEIVGQMTFTGVCGEPEGSEITSDEEAQNNVHSQRELLCWAQSLTQEQIDFLFNGGWYNNTLKGYVIAAAKDADFTDKQIEDLLTGVRFALSEKDKADAEKLYQDWN